MKGTSRSLVPTLLLALTAGLLVCGAGAVSADQAAAATAPGSLQVRVVGLPAPLRARARIVGPGVRAGLTQTRRFAKLRPGVYRISISPVRARGGRYFATSPRLTVRVRPGRRAGTLVRYSSFVPASTKPFSAKRLPPRSIRPRAIVLPSSAARRYRSGDVIVMGVGPQTPTGLIRRVTGVGRSAGGTTALTTAKADLRDALPRGEIRLELRPSGQVINGIEAGAADHRGQARVDVEPLEVDLARSFVSASAAARGCSARTGLSTTGKLSVSTGFELLATWGSNDAEISFDAEVAQRANPGLAASLTGSCEFSYRSPKVTIGVFTTFVGPIPIVIVPQLYGTLNAAVNGELEASAGVDQRLRLNAGLTASTRSGIRVRRSVEPSFTAAAPAISVFQGKASASAGPGLALQLYGATGISVDVLAGLELDITPLREPNWTMDGTVDVRAGVNLLGLRADRSLVSSRRRVASAPARTAISEQGVWRGPVVGSSTPHTMIMALTGGSGSNGEPIGTTDYPELNCGGRLDLISRDGLSTVIREEIIYGSENCVSTVTLVFRPGPTPAQATVDVDPMDGRSGIRANVTREVGVPDLSNRISAQEAGIWRGPVAGDSSSYDVRMELRAGPATIGQEVGSSSYTPLSCSGPLTYAGRTYTRVVLTERITTGVENCLPTGEVTFSAFEPARSWTFYGATNRLLTSTLTRE